MTTYYVDSATGNNANAGTSEAAPWLNIPGTRNAANSAFYSTTWGSISTSNKIQAGDTIYIKAGSAYTSSNSGRIQIDSNYYNSGTISNPITIRVSDTWGSGNVTYNASGMTDQAYFGKIHIGARDYIDFGGVSDSKRFVMSNASALGLVMYASSGTHATGNKLKFVTVTGAGNESIVTSFNDGFLIQDCKTSYGGSIGFAIGGVNDDVCIGGTLLRCEASYHTTGAQPQGFQVTGCTGIVYDACVAHHNTRDGFDHGSANNGANVSATYKDCISYSNGEDGFGANGSTIASGATSTANYINCIAFDNGQAGWTLYDSITANLYYCLAHSNGSSSGFGGNMLSFTTDSRFSAPHVKLRNSIFYKPKTFAQLACYQSTPSVWDIDYCVFVPRSSNSEVFVESPAGTNYTYTSPPSFINFGGHHNKWGTSYSVDFVASASTTTFASNDYHLQSNTSSVANAGVPLHATVTYTDKDIWGNTRSLTAPDIGVTEYAETATTLAAAAAQVQTGTADLNTYSPFMAASGTQVQTGTGAPFGPAAAKGRTFLMF